MIEFRVSRWGVASSPHSSPALPVPVRGCLPAFRGRDRGLLLSFRPLVRLVCWLFSLETSFLFSATLVFGVCYWFFVFFVFLFVLGAFVSVFWVRPTLFLVPIQWHRKIEGFFFFQNDLALKGD